VSPNVYKTECPCHVGLFPPEDNRPSCQAGYFGPTGQVALPVVEHYAKVADVYALARFRKAEDWEKIEALGATVLQADLADVDSLQVVPEDFDYVLNFAVVKSGLSHG
jgi:hypothetical protein